MLGILLYGILGLVQLAALQDGLTHWLVLAPAIVFALALFLAFLPVAGAAGGTVSTILVWGWPWYGAPMLFLGGFLLSVTLILSGRRRPTS